MYPTRKTYIVTKNNMENKIECYVQEQIVRKYEKKMMAKGSQNCKNKKSFFSFPVF